MSMEVERFKEQYSSVNIGVWIRDVDMKQCTAVKSVWCGNELPKRNLW